MVSGSNEVEIRFVLKFFKCTPTEIGFNIKCPRNATTRHNFDKEVILWNCADDGIYHFPDDSLVFLAEFHGA